MSVPGLLFFPPRTQKQLAFTVRASPPSIPLCPTTPPDLRQPVWPTDTYSKSKPTQSTENTNPDSLPRLKQSRRNFSSPQEAAPGPALVPSRVPASEQARDRA